MRNRDEEGVWGGQGLIFGAFCAFSRSLVSQVPPSTTQNNFQHTAPAPPAQKHPYRRGTASSDHCLASLGGRRSFLLRKVGKKRNLPRTRKHTREVAKSRNQQRATRDTNARARPTLTNISQTSKHQLKPPTLRTHPQGSQNQPLPKDKKHDKIT